MSSLVEFAPDRPQPDASLPGRVGEASGSAGEAPSGPSDLAFDGPEAAALAALTRLYEQRLDVYHRQLSSALGIIAVDPSQPGTDEEADDFHEVPLSAYPEVIVDLDGDETLVVDDSLFEQLFDIYTYFGWKGVENATAAVKVKVPDTDVSGGTVVSKWPPAWTFFTFTRDLLALAIRDALMGLEHRSATAMVPGLSKAAVAVSTAWTKTLKVERQKKTVVTSKGGDVTKPVWRFTEPGITGTLHTALTETITLRDRYAAAVQAVNDAEDDSPAGVEPSGAGPQRAMEDAEKLYAAGLQQIAPNMPMALLVADSLKAGFTQDDMSDALGHALWFLYERIDRIGTAVDPGRSRVAELVPGPVDLTRLTYEAVQRFAVPKGGIELAVVKAATDRLGDDSGWMPLLHEDSLHRLLGAKPEDRDSFTYVVFFRYLDQLIRELQRREQEERAHKKFWSAFSTFTASLNVATTVLLLSPAAPAGATGKAVLTAVNVAVDLIQIAHEISSFCAELDRQNRLLDNELARPTALGTTESLARIGQLGVYRANYIEQKAFEAVLQVAMRLAAPQWTSVRLGLMALGFYQDLDLLLGGDDEEEADDEASENVQPDEAEVAP